MDKITENLLTWYQNNKRDLPWRNTNNPYYIWISEIMLQQTRVEAVKNYYLRFIKELPTLKDLAEIEEDKLLKLWEGLGYYSRVKNMQKAAKILVSEGKENLPDSEENLLKLPGIGIYTAGAILTIAFNKRSLAIDGNVYRVLGRYYKIDESISKPSSYKIYAEYLKKILPKENYGDFTQSFMDLGSSICMPKNPKCDECPLKKECQAKKTNEVEKYPIKEKKKSQKMEERNVYVYLCEDKIAIQKRSDKGLLASMYELPNETKSLSMIDIENRMHDENIEYKYVKELGESKHVFSHIIWLMKGYLIELKEPIASFLWVTKEDLQNTYSLPTAFSYYINLFLNNKL